MSSEALAIEVQGLAKRYEIYAKPADRLRRMIFGRARRWLRLVPHEYARGFWALHPLDFTIGVGETVGIIGRNGSGKSTLLQLICGTLTPTQGRLRTQGRVAALLELGAGFNPEFTGEENVRLSGLLYGLPAPLLEQRLPSIIEFAELGRFIGQPVKTYSSGMYVRLAFAVAAHVDADVLIIDEALSVGDVRFSQKCARFLREFQQRGTLLFVSHDLSAVVNLCSRALWLDQGRLIRDGASKEVVEAYLAEQHAADRAASGAKVAVAAAERGGKAIRSTGRTDEAASTTKPRPGAGPIEVFSFDPDAVESNFGERRIEIDHVSLVDEEDGQRTFLAGRVVLLTIEAQAIEAADEVIFGFYVKDRLGQRLFGDNSFVTYLTSPVRANVGERLCARFRFRMPVMPAGEYTVDVAVATGTQLEHTQQHWIHDALSFRSDDMTLRHGLIGIPMLSIDIDVTEQAR